MRHPACAQCSRSSPLCQRPSACHPVSALGYNKLMILMRMCPCVLFVALIMGPVAQAATRFEVEAGFSNQVVENTFTPVRVRVQHDGPAVEGQLVLSQTVDTPWRGVFTETLSQPLKLGQRSNKAFTVYFPLNSTVYPLEAQIQNQLGKVIARQSLDLRDAAAGDRLVVAISETGFPANLPSGETVLSLQGEHLPDNVAGFESIRRIYLGRMNLAALERAQQQALLQWVMLGGDLVVFGGNNWFIQDTPLIYPWLPLVPAGVEPLAYASGETMPTLTGALRGSVIYASGENRPLILRRPVGQGYMWLTTVDPLAHTLSPSFWKALKQQSYQDEIPFPALAQNTFLQQSLSFPSREFVTAVLLIFTVGTGLLAWLGVRKFWAGMALFVWVALACVAVNVLLHQPQFSKALTAVEYGVESILPDGTAHLQTWLGLYAQRKEAVKATFPAEASVRQQLPTRRGNHLYDLDYVREAKHSYVSFNAQPQQVRALLSNELRPPSLLLRPVSESAFVVKTTVDLKQAWLWRHGTLYALGALRSGQPRRIELDALEAWSQDRLPSAVAVLWSWGRQRQRGGLLVGGWHAQGRVEFQTPTSKRTYRLVIGEVLL